MARTLDDGELAEHYTLTPDELALLRNKAGANRLGFSILLKHLLHRGRFPRGRGDVADNTIEFVARSTCRRRRLASTSSVVGRASGTAARSAGTPDSGNARSPTSTS